MDTESGFEGLMPDEIEALFEGGGEEPEGEEDAEPVRKESSAAGGSADEIAVLKQAIEEMKASMAGQKAETSQVMNLLSGVMNRPSAPAIASPQVPESTKQSEEDKRAAMEFAIKHSPELLGKLLEKDFESLSDKRLAAFEQKLEKKMSLSSLGKHLSENVLSHYNEELGKGDSELIRSAAQVKRDIAGLLDKDVVGTDLHDKLSFAIAAAGNPSVAAKIHSSRQATREAALEEARQRLSQLVGGGRSFSRSEQEITDEDRDIAKEWEIDIDDEDTRKRILARKASASENYIAQNRIQN